jgi:hypothetical protein
MQTPTHAGPIGLATPAATIVAAVRRLAAREGVAKTAQMLGVGRDTITRLRGGIPVRRGSLVVAVQALSAIDPAVHP